MFEVKNDGSATFKDFEKRLDAFYGSSLVPTPISQHVTSSTPPQQQNLCLSTEQLVDRFELYRNSLKKKIVPPLEGKPEPPNRKESQIEGFSSGSRRRLRHTSINAFPELISQFVMTFHDYLPIDGRELKRLLNSFLQRLRIKYPGIGYLWILEFQERGAPHFHLFLTLPVTEENRIWLAETWNRIADPTSEKHLWWHRDRKTTKNGKEYSSFIPWEMGSGAYLCKYLEKENQKNVPDGFYNVGRFWGASRGLVPDPDVIPLTDFDELETDELKPREFINRTIARYHEKIDPYHKKKFGRSLFRSNSSYTVLTAAPICRQTLKYLKRGKENDNFLL